MSEAQSPARPVLPSEQENFVTLREFEQRLAEIGRLYDERTRYEREILSTRENSLKEALSIASLELARRLEELNHAHTAAMENWRTSLPREVFEANWTEFRTWRDKVNTDLTTLAQMPATIAGLSRRIGDTEQAMQQAQGALTLIRFMGFAGVIALLVTFARMVGLVP